MECDIFLDSTKRYLDAIVNRVERLQKLKDTNEQISTTDACLEICGCLSLSADAICHELAAIRVQKSG